MIVIKLIGGLGNQMFQYAAALALSKKKGFKLFFDARALAKYRLHKYGGFERLNITISQLRFPYSLRWPYWLVRKYQKLKIQRGFYLEYKFNYSSEWENISDGTYIEGYFQSEKYFSEIKSDLQREFSLSSPLSLKNQNYVNEINATESVMVHVRRGDYVMNNATMAIHGVCSQRYYENALEMIYSKLDNPKFFVFSDDILWCKANLNFSNEAQFVVGNEQNPEVDIWLMSQCKHHIIANSSFSWWGAWLANSANQTVVAPTPWFDSDMYDSKDLCPDWWIRVDKY